MSDPASTSSVQEYTSVTTINSLSISSSMTALSLTSQPITANTLSLQPIQSNSTSPEKTRLANEIIIQTAQQPSTTASGSITITPTVTGSTIHIISSLLPLLTPTLTPSKGIGQVPIFFMLPLGAGLLTLILIIIIIIITSAILIGKKMQRKSRLVDTNSYTNS